MQIKFMLWCVVAILLSLIFACGDDTATTKESTAQVRLKITDAPIDDQSVMSAVITISEIYLGEFKLEAFAGATIDLLQYQNGEVFTIGDFEVPAGSYDQLRLVLDLATTVQGETPGSYIQDADGVKHSLITSNATVDISLNEEILEGDDQSYVIDFDLRKSIIYTPDGTDDFDFVTNEELVKAIRVENESESLKIIGTIEGINDAELNKSIVFLYKKDEFDANIAVSGQGQSQVAFANAVSSAVIDSDGNFELHFIPDGVYELQVATYDFSEEGRAELKGFLTIGNSGILGSVLEGLEVNLSADTELTLTAEGLIAI